MISPGLGEMIPRVGAVEGATTLLVTVDGLVLIVTAAALIVVVGAFVASDELVVMEGVTAALGAITMLVTVGAGVVAGPAEMFPRDI